MDTIYKLASVTAHFDWITPVLHLLANVFTDWKTVTIRTAPGCEMPTMILVEEAMQQRRIRYRVGLFRPRKVSWLVHRRQIGLFDLAVRDLEALYTKSRLRPPWEERPW
ncbi:MAG: hypothetical protein Kow0047_34180 [Anaerolineae bacterium]